MKLIAIAACSAKDGVLGKDGKLPWNQPDDLRRFRRLTTGHPVIMGRKTYQSLGKPLPNRFNIVISRNPKTWYKPGQDEVLVVHGLEQALEVLEILGAHQAFVIGGGELYAAAMPRCDELLLTLVDAPVEGDTYFRTDMSGMELVDSQVHPADGRNEFNMVFQRWSRIPLED